ncbi:hypothetical protein IQ215_13435 [Cyanobacterium stanieri LEGE 03274]|uniref:Uncharacterized protein n=1 Tax=Cyanobacterium stanieri LEGE 03274 TaxID=1828756 RepID=A0ABR9V982_9CHRO|nr:hypothetical protein [Cyanobacterium stanieri]MBE9223701.1 hypothetical protein [Cyanobacterium stanieri LEGE 03274]
MYNYSAEILIRHYLIPLPSSTNHDKIDQQTIATIVNNFAYYGYALSEISYKKLIETDRENIINWWLEVQPVLEKITGNDKNIADFVVYKNFPQEVLAMSEVEYWTNQILMYWGFPNHFFTEEKQEKPPLKEKINFKVLHPAQNNSLLEIFNSIVYLPNRWVEQQWDDVHYLLNTFVTFLDVNKIPFKENLIKVLIYCLNSEQNVNINSATDVLRLAVGLSDGDISLRKPTKFRNFKRKERRFLLNLLNQCPNLVEDIFRHKNIWKKLMFALHPGDYATQFSRVVNAYNLLFNNQAPETFNSILEKLLAQKDGQVLDLLSSRPGEFLRRLHHCILLFDHQAVIKFQSVIPELTTIQLLKLQSYLETINYRLYRAIAPKGNWRKMQVLEMDEKRKIEDKYIDELLENIGKEIKKRVNKFAPVVNLDPKTDMIKLQTNDSELTPYGRGTIFPIPENIKFIRTASYWKSGATNYNIWYDNSWNFFQSDWTPLGSCCWTDVFFANGGAIFSGDPTNSKDLEGNACQLIDLYLPELLAYNVRYAVWNVLCFNYLSFNKAKEVYGFLQWGENPENGNLFEPSRCQLSFPIKGDDLTKYIALIDLVKNQIIYLDASLYGVVSSANNNLAFLQEKMPPFLEYLETLPSVFDLFKHQDSGLPIVYSDANFNLKNNQDAYVFKPENKHNQFNPFSLTKILQN